MKIIAVKSLLTEECKLNFFVFFTQYLILQYSAEGDIQKCITNCT
jgi:hypothetical protein